MIADELVSYLVQFCRRDTRSDVAGEFTKRAANQLIGSAHEFYLVFCL
jgi:hypothetical protein